MPKENIEMEDATLKKGKKNAKKTFRTMILIIILVLVADLCILLALNKVGVININNQISNVPVLNTFVNEEVKKKEEIDTTNSLVLEKEALEKQLQISEADMNILASENEKLTKENKELEEKILKLENKNKDTEKLVEYYKKMKPKQAGAAFNSLDANLALEILNGMDESTAAAILDKTQPEKVVEITKASKGTKE